MADYSGCTSFGALAPEVYIDKVERLPDQGRTNDDANLTGESKTETVSVRMSFRQEVRNQAQKMWFSQPEALGMTNIRVIATTNPNVTRKILYLSERIKRFKLARSNTSQAGLSDLTSRQQDRDIKNLYKLIFSNKRNTQHDTVSSNLLPYINGISPNNDTQMFDIPATRIIPDGAVNPQNAILNSREEPIGNGKNQTYQIGTTIFKKRPFELSFRFFSRHEQTPEINGNGSGISKSIDKAEGEGHLSIFAFCYLNLRDFGNLAPARMTDLNPITTGDFNFVNVIGSYDESYLDQNLQELFDIKYPGSKTLPQNGDFLGRGEAYEGIFARPEDIFYLDPEIVTARGERAADNDARARAEERSEILRLDGEFHSHTNEDGVVSYMPGRSMREYRRRVLRENQVIRPPQVFGPGRDILRDKRQLNKITGGSPFTKPLENNLERLFAELSDGIRSFGEKQVNKLFNTEGNYFSNAWITKDHQENIRLMFAFDLGKVIEDNSAIYHLLKKPAFREIVDSLDYPVYDIKDVKISRKRVRLRPGMSNSLGSGLADDPIDEYNVEEYIGSAKPTQNTPRHVSDAHEDKLLKFFYITDDMKLELETQKTGHFQYTAEAAVVDNSVLVIKSMLDIVARDLKTLEAQRANIDYGGQLFDSNGVINNVERLNIYQEIFLKINILSNFLDALIPREEQFSYLKDVSQNENLSEADRQALSEGRLTQLLGAESSVGITEDLMVGAGASYRLILADLAAESCSGTIESALESLDSLIDIYKLTQNSILSLIKRAAPNYTFTGDPGNRSSGPSQNGGQRTRVLKVRKQFEQTAQIGKYYKSGYEYILPRNPLSEGYQQTYIDSQQAPGFSGQQFRTMSPITYGKRTAFEKLKFYRGTAREDSLFSNSVQGKAGSYLTPASIRTWGGGILGSRDIFFQNIKTRNLYGLYQKLLVDLIEMQFGNEQTDYYFVKNGEAINKKEQQQEDSSRTASLMSMMSNNVFSFAFANAFAGAKIKQKAGEGIQGDADNIFGQREKLDEGSDNFARSKKLKGEFSDINDEENNEVRNRQVSKNDEDVDFNKSFVTLSDRALFSMFKQFIMAQETEAGANSKFDSIAKVAKQFPIQRGDEGFDDEYNSWPVSIQALYDLGTGGEDSARLPVINVDKDQADRLRNQDRFNSLNVEIPDREDPLSVYDPMKDPSKFAAFWLNHKQIVRVEYLASFGGGNSYSIKNEKWLPLTMEDLFFGGFRQFERGFSRRLGDEEQSGQQEAQAARRAMQGNIQAMDYLICRLVPYDSGTGKVAENFGVRKIDTFDLPIYDRYFILHHGYDSIDQFQNLIDTREPDEIEQGQPLPPPPPPPEPEPEEIRNIGRNEEENQEQLGNQIINIVDTFVRDIPGDLNPLTLLLGLDPGAGSPPQKVRNKEMQTPRFIEPIEEIAPVNIMDLLLGRQPPQVQVEPEVREEIEEREKEAPGQREKEAPIQQELREIENLQLEQVEVKQISNVIQVEQQVEKVRNGLNKFNPFSRNRGKGGGNQGGGGFGFGRGGY
jgi:hypothetical protein|tara:strand:+ start:791 stop:5380 length:4590 start_codon:yes stop_codon:yes gene_type:complete